MIHNIQFSWSFSGKGLYHSERELPRFEVYARKRFTFDVNPSQIKHPHMHDIMHAKLFCGTWTGDGLPEDSYQFSNSARNKISIMAEFKLFCVLSLTLTPSKPIYISTNTVPITYHERECSSLVALN